MRLYTYLTTIIFIQLLIAVLNGNLNFTETALPKTKQSPAAKELPGF